MERPKRKYAYDGPVLQFGKVVANNWTDTTLAVSPSKARSNFIYRFKTRNNLIASSSVTMPGTITEIT